MSLKFKKIFFLLAIIIGGFFWLSVQAATVNQGITVNATVPSNGGGGGGGGGNLDNNPTISNVTSSVSFTTANLSWNAADDKGIASVTFVYGVTPSYGSSSTISGSYQTNIVNLVTGTLYYFKISVTDTGAHVTTYSSTFSTAPTPSPPADTTPPIISNIQVSSGVTTATIKWDTDELADSQVNYGLNNSYGNNFFDAVDALTHSVPLTNLAPNTIYHYQIISTDSSGNSASTAATFTTQADSVPPPDVSNFVLSTTTNSIVLSWTNPSLSGTPDFSGVKVVRKIGSSSASPGDGTVVYSGSGENFTDINVIENINYFYTIFSFDTSNNNSPGIFRSGQIVPQIISTPPAEICGNGLDDDNNGYTDCADSACAFSSQCIPPPPSSTPSAEICNNGIDDDNNGKIDCADSACVGFGSCVNQVFACSDGIDNDGDGKIDFPADPGCESQTDNDEYNPPEPTVPEFVRMSLDGVLFFAANRHITLVPTNEAVTGLSGINLTIAIPEAVLFSAPQSLVLRVGNTDVHQFVHNTADKMYYADLSFGQAGLTQAYIEINYGNDQVDSVAFKLNSLSFGQVVDGQGRSLGGVALTLYGADGSVAPMGYYGQLNPITSNINGSFGWFVPNGDYKIYLEKDGYYSRLVTVSNISNHTINSQLSLFAFPPKLDLTIDSKISLSANIKKITKALAGKAKNLSAVEVQKIQDAIASPQVQQINQQVVAPAVFTAVAVGAASFISWLDFLPFLRLLFLQPLMLLGWRKREKWGFVYNSLNKLPVDLAIVRLINADNNRIVQSKVTDSKGRFIFMVDPGKYRLQAQKSRFVFPSNFLAGATTDGQKVDIYHGEVIEVISPTSITATIPLDPVEATKKPSRLFWQKFGRTLQTLLSIAGIVLTAVSLYISPKWYIAVLLFLHVVIFFVFRKLAMPSKPKNWGFVYDDSSRAPISRVVARLFNSQFNKLVDMQVTDSAGKYYFMAGDAKYYVTYEHKQYHPRKTDIIDLEGKEAESITIDVSLKRD